MEGHRLNRCHCCLPYLVTLATILLENAGSRRIFCKQDCNLIRLQQAQQQPPSKGCGSLLGQSYLWHWFGSSTNPMTWHGQQPAAWNTVTIRLLKNHNTVSTEPHSMHEGAQAPPLQLLLTLPAHHRTHALQQLDLLQPGPAHHAATSKAAGNQRGCTAACQASHGTMAR